MNWPAVIVGLIVAVILVVTYLGMRWADSFEPLDVEQEPKDSP